MFYCDACAKTRRWPTPTFSRSYGPCEICSVRRVCNDVPSSLLPIPPAAAALGVTEGDHRAK